MPVPSSFGGSGNSIRDTQRKMTNDFGASEKMRMEALQRDRLRITKQRALDALQEKKRKLDLNKNEMNQKEADVRRLTSELARESIDARDTAHAIDHQNEQVVREKAMVNEVHVKVEKTEAELKQLKSQSDKLELELKHMESERIYKDKTKDAKAKRLREIEIAKQRQENEVSRLRGENMRLEREIQQLEREAK